MLKAILTDMKINTSIKFYPDDKEKKTYCIFRICTIRPDKKGVYFTADCRASNRLCEEVQRLNLHEKSTVDIVADLTQYLKDGKLVTSYEISEITINDKYPEKEEPKDTKANAEKAMNKFLLDLSTDPFKRGGRKNGNQ